MTLNLGITGFYAALLAIWLLFLSFNIIRLRWKHSVGIGHGDVSELDKAIRVHGNFSEYVPLALVLLAIVEMGGLSDMWLHIFGGMLLLGRISHAAGLFKTKGPTALRVAGMSLTFLMLLSTSIIAINQFIG